MTDTQLNPGDLEPTDLGLDDPEAPLGRLADGSPRRRRAPTRTSVDPNDVLGGDGDEGETQKDRRDRAKKAKADKERAQAVAEVKAMVDGKINPMLAMASRMALQVEAEVDAWMTVDQDEDGSIKLDNRGIPKYRYTPAAQMCILQPFEVEILTMVAPSAMNAEAMEKAREFGKKAAPYVAVGAVAAFAGSYYLRLREVGKALEVEKAKRKDGGLGAHSRQDGDDSID